MSRLRLFTAFHANLDFSALPEADRAEVIARCYWPLLALPEEHGIPIGFELSVRTLEILLAEDPEWVKRFAGLVERGAIELIGSGHAQVVAPLAPAEINRLNLALAIDGYQHLLGQTPSTWFVNEQTWSEGLGPLYREAGAARIVMEWNNPAASRPELRPLRCRPARLKMPDGDGPGILWNDSIVFQKVQRAAHGETPIQEVWDYAERLARRPESQVLCIYGGDVEIFDYRPSRTRGAHHGEMDRLIGLLVGLADRGGHRFVLPREVAGGGDHARCPEVTLGSGADPIPCKKQPRYNPTRWAVSGRDGLGMNTRCHALLQQARAVRRLSAGAEQGVPDRDLVDLWRSDFRTRSTEEKVVEFGAAMGLARHRTAESLAAVVPALREQEDLVVVNPGPFRWSGAPVEIPLQFAPGRFPGLALHTRRGAPLAEGDYQIEVIGRHRDGSLREARLVLCPDIAPGEALAVAFEAKACAQDAAANEEIDRLRTASVEVELLPHRGAALGGLAFPGLSARPWLGTIPHGTFETIAFTPDFYSAHVVALTERAEKRTDLSAVRIERVDAESGPVRTTLLARYDSPFGPWTKRYRVYHAQPRLDVVHEMAFHDARLASLRLGSFTLRPESWSLPDLRQGTVNGGASVEWYGLDPAAPLRQSAAVSAGVSATSCLGATEGWVAIEDGDKGVVISSDRGRAAVVPLVDFEAVDEGFFCRVSHSAAETDETRASFLRGRLEFGFAVEGFAAGDQRWIERARSRNHGLAYRTENQVGISSGL